ncbi:MAG: hypothetical protein BWX45_01008 [Deltaproteobacteria bacterium ADurb.Bin002]|nr:MAG: hypothetical protein BWX45_01008 [Deltaproteobacteria bacterium ADurb.Bin002]
MIDLRPEIDEYVKISLFLFHQSEGFVTEGHQLVPGLGKLPERLLQTVPKIGVHLLEQLEKQVFLVFEVVVDQPRGQAGFLGNILDGEVVVPLLRNHLVSRRR